MRFENLKKGLFGYKKAGVYEFVTEINEELSRKILEKDAQAREQEEQLETRIKQLEEELTDVKQQYEAQIKERDMIAMTLLEAQRHAEALKKEAELKAAKERREWEAELAQKQQELNRYHARVQKLREMFVSLLRDMDEQADVFEQEIQSAEETAPSRHIALFQRKKEEAVQ